MSSLNALHGETDVLAAGCQATADAVPEALLQVSFGATIPLIEGDFMDEIMATMSMVKRNKVKGVK